MDEHSALTALIRRGRRRRLLHLLIQETAFASAAALAASILLLALGTQILNWYWPAALFVGALSAGVWRLRARAPSSYEVAQGIDARLGFKDALATAFFFSEHAGRASSPREIVGAQRAAAEKLAGAADLRLGVPFFAPRSLYLSVLLAMLAFGTLALRYGVTRSLNLQPSLVRIAFEGLLGSPGKAAAAADKKQGGPLSREDARQQGLALDAEQTQALDLDPAAAAALNTVETPDVDNAGAAPSPGVKTTAKNEPDAQPPDEGDSAANGDKPAGSDQIAGNGSSPGDQGQSGKQAGSKDSNQASDGAGENSSLTDKMRDALANLMAKLKMQPKTGEGKQSAAGSKNGSQTAQRQSASKEQNGSPSPGKPQEGGSSSPDAQGDPQAEGGQQSQAAQGQSNGKNSDKNNTQDAKSGVGKQDGDKSAKEAEQLAAMGKISEIIGKRSASVSGEMMVEVASGKQQLRTQYSQRKAAHGEAGGDVNRDEIPLAYQQYVQQYFEEIRKLPASKKAAQEPKAKAPGT